MGMTRTTKAPKALSAAAGPLNEIQEAGSMSSQALIDRVEAAKKRGEEAMGEYRQAEDDLRQQVLLPAMKKQVGRCFRYRNCYSCPESDRDYWWMFCRITGVVDFALELLTVQRDRNAKISVEMTSAMPNVEGQLEPRYEPMSEEEWCREVRPLLGQVCHLAGL
jgi:hypothetical protein